MNSSAFLPFVYVFAIHIAKCLFSAAAVYLVVCRVGHKWLAKRRIQQIPRADRAQFIREMKSATQAILVWAACTTGVFYFYKVGHTSIITVPPGTGWGWVVADFILIVLWKDCWFYWSHRWLHTKWMFQHIHYVHHESFDPTPVTAYSFHPVEAFILRAGVLLFIFAVPTYLPALLAFQFYSLWRNLENHMGYELMPSWVVKIAPFKYRAGSTFRNLHHSHVNGNYAFYFRWWDRWCRTEFPMHDQVFLRATEGPSVDLTAGKTVSP